MGDVILMLVVQSCPPLCDPMDCSLPGSSLHGIFQARVLEWVAISSPVLMLKEAYYYKHRFHFYHFHVSACNVTGSFQRIQLVLQWASLSQNLNRWGVGFCFLFFPISLTESPQGGIQLEIWRPVPQFLLSL